MKFEIGSSNQNRYFIIIRSNDGFYDSDDREIVKKLDISFKKFSKILKKHNAILTQYGYHFENRQNCEQCIEELNPYLIMKNLTIWGE